MLFRSAGGADGLSLINTIKSLIGVDLETLALKPAVGSESTNGGYCGPAVKPIALHMVAALARDQRIGVPISGIGGISDWRDAAEFLALQGDRAKDGRHGPQTAAAGLAEAAAPPMTAAAPSAIRVFLRKSRFMIDIILISNECC